MCRQTMALESLVRYLPAPLRLYFAKSTRWQVEAVFRNEVIAAALCCSKFSKFVADGDRRGTRLREGKIVLVKEVTKEGGRCS